MTAGSALEILAWTSRWRMEAKSAPPGRADLAKLVVERPRFAPRPEPFPAFLRQV